MVWVGGGGGREIETLLFQSSRKCCVTYNKRHFSSTTLTTAFTFLDVHDNVCLVCKRVDTRHLHHIILLLGVFDPKVKRIRDESSCHESCPVVTFFLFSNSTYNQPVTITCHELRHPASE